MRNVRGGNLKGEKFAKGKKERRRKEEKKKRKRKRRKRKRKRKRRKRNRQRRRMKRSRNLYIIQITGRWGRGWGAGPAVPCRLGSGSGQ